MQHNLFQILSHAVTIVILCRSRRDEVVKKPTLKIGPPPHVRSKPNPHTSCTNLEQEAIRRYEDELIASLLRATPKSVLNLAMNVQQMQLVRHGLVNNLESLDPSVPHKLRCRYLMLHVYEGMTSCIRFKSWLRVLSMVEGTGEVLSLTKQYYNSRECKASAIHNEEEYEDGFGKAHLPVLMEVLRDYAYLWEEFATSFHLPITKIKEISATTTSKLVSALSKVLLSWIEREFEHAKPATIRVLEEVLRSKMMGLGAKANNLREEIDKCLTKPISKSRFMAQETDEIELDSLDSKLRIIEGNSVLLEVHTHGNPEAQYEWCKKDNHGSFVPLKKEYSTMMYEDIHCNGYSESILYLSVKDLFMGGSYRCNVHFNEETLHTDPINVIVRTPLDKHQRVLIDRYTVQPEIPVDTWPP